MPNSAGTMYPFGVLLYVLEHFSCEEENEPQILLALYIRLEFSIQVS